jgi:DnaJ-class molecular chaperone
MYMDKIIKLATKLEGLIPESSSHTAQDIYESLTSIMKKQEIYFDVLKPESVIKLTICIYSFKKTGDFKLAANILSNIFYAGFVSTENETHYESCDECYGDGYVNCEDCDGNGSVTCEDCDEDGNEDCDDCGGTGVLDCSTCDGSGELEDEERCADCNGSGMENCDTCNGGGKTTCSTCGGDREKTCRDCSGDGSYNCPDCDGSGEQETDEIKFSVISICSWDDSLRDRCELNVNTETPIGDTVKVYNSDKIIVLYTEEDLHGTAEFELSSDELYCFGYYFDDNVELNKRNNKRLYIDYQTRDIETYINE